MRMKKVVRKRDGDSLTAHAGQVDRWPFSNAPGSHNADERRGVESMANNDERDGRGELIVAQTDGELLRGASGLEAGSVELVQTAVALSSLLSSDPSAIPVYVDIENDEGRLFSAAYDDEFVIAQVGERSASRTEFVERARALYFE